MKIENHGEHLIALHALDDLMREKGNGKKHKTDSPWMELLADTIDAYEQEHFPVGVPDAFTCPACSYNGPPVLNDAGDDIACAKCGAKLVGHG